MGVTDLNGSLPWWATQGGPAGSGGPPGGAAMPGGQSWLDYLASMFGPNSAQAAESDPTATLRAQLANRAPGPPKPDTAMAAALPTGPPPSPSGSPSWFPSGQNNPMPWNGPTATPPPRPAAPPAPTAGLDHPATLAAARTAFAAPGPTAAPRAEPQGGGPMANNRFVQLDQGQNIDPTGRRGSPQMTALNLAGLFGGGQPATPAAAAPRVAGPLAQSGPPKTAGQPPTTLADAAYGVPDARGAPYPYPRMGPNQPPGARTMNPSQLASAVKQPNWWQHLIGNA